MASIRSADEAVVARRLDGQFRDGEDHAREDVNDDLLIDRARRPPPMPKDPVAPKQAGEEGMHARLLPAVRVLQQQAAALVQQGEFRQIRGVLPRGLVDEPELLAYGAGAEEEDHDERVGEADFGAVDEAVADGFEQDEGLVVGGVEDDFALDILL